MMSSVDMMNGGAQSDLNSGALSTGLSSTSLDAMAALSDAQLQQYQNGLDASTLSGSLGGPDNPFGQQDVNFGSLGNLSSAVAGTTRLPSFQAPQGTPQAQSLTSLAADISGGAAGNPATGLPSQTQTQGFLSSLPTPNKIAPVQFGALPKDSQDFLLSAYGAMGYSPQDVSDTVKAALPGDAGGPKYGLASGDLGDSNPG